MCSMLCHFIRSKILYQIEEGEYEYPNKVHKVPVQPDFLHHFITSAALIGAQNYVEENYYVQQDPDGNVEPVETCNKEKEICKKRMPVFVVSQVGAFHHACRFIVQLGKGSLSGQNHLFSRFGQLLGTNQKIRIRGEASFYIINSIG